MTTDLRQGALTDDDRRAWASAGRSQPGPNAHWHTDPDLLTDEHEDVGTMPVSASGVHEHPWTDPSHVHGEEDENLLYDGTRA